MEGYVLQNIKNYMISYAFQNSHIFDNIVKIKTLFKKKKMFKVKY